MSGAISQKLSGLSCFRAGATYRIAHVFDSLFRRCRVFPCGRCLIASVRSYTMSETTNGHYSPMTRIAYPV
jgi:hypothetical protein